MCLDKLRNCKRGTDVKGTILYFSDKERNKLKLMDSRMDGRDWVHIEAKLIRSTGDR